MARPQFRALLRDGIAGTVTAALLVPQALAYALLAGLPPEAGFYAAMFPALVYALTGTSPALSVGPVAVVSLMVATTLLPLAPPGSAEYWQDALVLALLSGVMLLVLGLLRLGVLINFLSYPVISGFAMGAAALIVLSQLPQALGVHGSLGGNSIAQSLSLLQALPSASAATLAVSLISLGLLLAAQLLLPRLIPAQGRYRLPLLAASRLMPLAIILGGSYSATHVAWLGGKLQLVGHLPGGLPGISPPGFDWARWRALLGPAALIGLIGYLEGVSIARVLARRHRHEIKANRELVAVGLAGIVAAFSHGMPVAGSLSRSVVNDASGARTRLAGAVTALLVMASSVVLTPILQNLPRAVLAAVIMVAVLRLFDWQGLRRVWRHDRADGLAWVVTTCGVLAIGAETGFVAGLVVSLLFYVWRTANPHIAELGHAPHSGLFLDLERHHDLETWPQLLLVRIDESLFFGNAAAVQNFIADRVSSRSAVSDAILACGAVNAIDASAMQMLEDLCDALAASGVTLHLCGVKAQVMDRIEGSRLLQMLGRQRVHTSLPAAISALASPPI